MLEKQLKIKSEKLIENPFWDYYIDDYQFNDEIYKYYYVNSRGAVFIIPKLDNDLFILTKQFRYLNQKESVEFPGGGKKVNLTDEQNALNELLEETGYLAKEINNIGYFNPYNGVTNEICNIFLAKDLELLEQKLDNTEQIDVLILSKKEINQMIENNEIWDGMTLAAWAMYLNSKEQKQ